MNTIDTNCVATVLIQPDLAVESTWLKPRTVFIDMRQFPLAEGLLGLLIRSLGIATSVSSVLKQHKTS